MDPTYRQAARAERGQRQWMFLFFVVAISLWLQWLGPGALAEVRSEDGSESVLALQLLPLAALVLAAMWNHSIGRLTLFPISFIPGLVMLPDAELEALTTPGSLLLALSTLALYLVISAARPPEASYGVPRRRPAQAGEGGDGYSRSFRRFVGVRMAVMGALFAVITFALFWDPSVAEALAAVDGEAGRKTQHAFVAVVMYFAWMVAVYMGALLPSLNWEYHRRRPPLKKESLARPGRLRRRVWIWLALLMTMTTSTFLWLVL